MKNRSNITPQIGIYSLLHCSESTYSTDDFTNKETTITMALKVRRGKRLSTKGCQLSTYVK
jgi:hypothetical protein